MKSNQLSFRPGFRLSVANAKSQAAVMVPAVGGKEGGWDNLRTDDEAAGTPPSSEAVRLAYVHETANARANSEKKDSDHGVAIYVDIVTTAVISVAAALWPVEPP